MRAPGRILALLALFQLSAPVHAARIKDLSDFQGVRANALLGYGIVVGLQGTGDNLGNAVFTKESVVGMLARLGVNTRGSNLQTKNVAAVMVTGVLPPFARQGSRVDVTVSALGNAKSLLGGTLLVTPLIGADGEVYAVSQGQIAVGGFEAAGQAESISKGVPTSGRIASGAIVEREVPFELRDMDQVRLALRNPDFTTARRIEAAINKQFNAPAAAALDPGTVTINLAAAGGRDVVDTVGLIEQLEITPDLPARVIIDEQTGVIVMGEKVRISTVAIAQGNLTIRVTETPQVSQPAPFAQNGDTTVVPRSAIDVQDDSDRRLAVVESGVSLQDLVDGLNALGIGPRDMISILQAIKAAGALHADIQVM